jgi:hypothetical protein
MEVSSIERETAGLAREEAMPDDGPDNGAGVVASANDWPLSVAPAPREPLVIEGARPRELPEICKLKVGGQDERGNTVKYIYLRSGLCDLLQPPGTSLCQH